MSTIEAVYIIDINGRTVLNFPVEASPPELDKLVPLVIKGDYISSIRRDRHTEIPAIVEISPSRVLYSQRVGNNIFMLPCSSKTPALLPFEFINRLVEVFEDFFSPPLLSMKIESNYDTVTHILHEMINGSYPYSTETDIIRDVVPYGGVLKRLLSTSSGPTTVSSIPWRRANVRHNYNELFVDIIESLFIIIPSSKQPANSPVVPTSSAFYSANSSSNISNGSGVSNKPLVCRVEGNIFVTSKLSGTPEVQLVLGLKGHKIEYPSFHRCIRLASWQQSPWVLSFIPPDGKTLVASYTLDGLSGKNRLVFAQLKKGLGLAKDEFEVRVWTVVSWNLKHIEGLYVAIECGPETQSVQNVRVTAGDFHYNDNGVGEWRFSGNVGLGWRATLRGTLKAHEAATVAADSEGKEDKSGSTSAEREKEPKCIFPKYISLQYSAVGSVPTGITVNSLKITGNRSFNEGHEAFKGVKYLTNIGEYVVR